MISDGRDVSPRSGAALARRLARVCEEAGARLATLCGRFYAMDRDKRWERTRVYYELLVGKQASPSGGIKKGPPQEAGGPGGTQSLPADLCFSSSSSTCKDFEKYILANYEQGITDEFLPGVRAEGFEGIGPEDGLIFINFRNDRMRQLVAALTQADFEGFSRDELFANALCMCPYDEGFDLPVLFERQEVRDTLAEVISRAGLSQFHTAETEKYAHVTFFFNGGREEILPGERRVLIPSPKVKTYDEQPQMSAAKVCEAVKTALREGFDFIVVNFANGDMVGHTGDFDAAVEAVEAVDGCLGQLLDLARERDYALIITSDHGNCEQMRDEAGQVLTNHTTFEVFVFAESPASRAAGEKIKIKPGLGLSSLAATVLGLLGLAAPAAMDEALF